MPHGLDDLGDHNLITFKSHREALDDGALKELTGHYVNYRKQASPSLKDLLPEVDFKLFAVAARYPHNLASVVSLQQLAPGVLRCQRGTDDIRIVVLGDLAEEGRNALMYLFTGKPAMVRYGAENYRPRSAETSTLINKLFEGYRKEGLTVPYTMEDFKRDYTKEHLKDLTVDERIEGISTEELLKRISPEERLKGLSEQDIAAYLSRRKADEPPAPPKE